LEVLKDEDEEEYGWQRAYLDVCWEMGLSLLPTESLVQEYCDTSEGARK